jgi:hypothetical protein
MTLQADIMLTKPGLIDFLLSKFNPNTAAVGVRPQLNYSQTEPILHSLGCMWDTEKFLQLDQGMEPDFPNFDVGEKAISLARSRGWETVGLRNTYLSPGTEQEIRDPTFRTFLVDRTLDDDNEVIFMHLGRGIPRALGENRSGVGIDEWQNFYCNLAM